MFGAVIDAEHPFPGGGGLQRTWSFAVEPLNVDERPAREGGGGGGVGVGGGGGGSVEEVAAEAERVGFGSSWLPEE